MSGRRQTFAVRVREHASTTGRPARFPLSSRWRRRHQALLAARPSRRCCRNRSRRTAPTAVPDHPRSRSAVPRATSRSTSVRAGCAAPRLCGTAAPYKTRRRRHRPPAAATAKTMEPRKPAGYPYRPGVRDARQSLGPARPRQASCAGDPRANAAVPFDMATLFGRERIGSGENSGGDAWSIPDVVDQRGQYRCGKRSLHRDRRAPCPP